MPCKQSQLVTSFEAGDGFNILESIGPLPGPDDVAFRSQALLQLHQEQPAVFSLGSIRFPRPGNGPEGMESGISLPDHLVERRSHHLPSGLVSMTVRWIANPGNSILVRWVRDLLWRHARLRRDEVPN